ncbi:hypothetical protein ILYODFUR_012224 [Ilyodon furcidens]|uniref:Uncharacterized protein n=1 Tax=Ilyodon furcidens TaxID=33524 RepID=A0ABV0UFJ4_9TELE
MVTNDQISSLDNKVMDEMCRSHLMLSSVLTSLDHNNTQDPYMLTNSVMTTRPLANLQSNHRRLIIHTTPSTRHPPCLTVRRSGNCLHYITQLIMPCREKSKLSSSF